MKNATTAAVMAFASAFFTAPAAALDEETLAFEGRWQVLLQPAAGPPRRAVLRLSNYGGHWTESASAGARAAACSTAKPYPVTVQKSVTTELEFSVFSAALAPGCTNLSITVAPAASLHAATPKMLKGSSAEGHVVTMTRP